MELAARMKRTSEPPHQATTGTQEHVNANDLSAKVLMSLTRIHYLHHRIDCEPLAWNAVAKALAAQAPAIEAANGLLYGVWRSQIGQPRDTLNAITAWSGAGNGWAAFMDLFKSIDGIRAHDITAMTPTLRPAHDAAPKRQGNFAFRWFETPTQNWQEFLDLCARSVAGF